MDFREKIKWNEMMFRSCYRREFLRANKMKYKKITSLSQLLDQDYRYFTHQNKGWKIIKGVEVYVDHTLPNSSKLKPNSLPDIPEVFGELEGEQMRSILTNLDLRYYCGNLDFRYYCGNLQMYISDDIRYSQDFYKLLN